MSEAASGQLRTDPGRRPLAIGWRIALARFAAVALSLSIGAATAQAQGADLQSQLRALDRNITLPPADVLQQVRALSPAWTGAALPERDLARLVEIRALLDIGSIPEADRLAHALMSEPGRDSSPMAMVRARLGLLRVRLRQSEIRESAQLAREILLARSAFEEDELAPELFDITGTALSRTGDFEPAARLYIEGLKSAERLGRNDEKAYLLIGLCNINYDMQNPGKALEYCQQAAQLADQTGNKLARAAVAINLALGYEARDDFKDQLDELQKSLALSREMGLKRAEGMANINLAEYALTRNDTKAGLAYCREGLRIGRELSDPIMIGVSLTNLGTVTADMGDTSAGIQLYEDGLKEVEKAGETAYVVDFLPGLADLYEKAGRMPDALKAMRQRVEQGDKLFQKRQSDALAIAQGKYDADSRQREIRLLMLDNQLKSVALERRNLELRTYWLVGAMLVLVSVVLVFAYRRVRAANKVLASQNLELEAHSLCDPLTGLFNRRALKSMLDLRNTGSRPPRKPLPPLALVMVDVDHFKRINDRWGHSHGDAVLVELARRLTRLVRPEDRVFRLGGEEFLLVLADISGDDLSHWCQRILGTVESEPVHVDTQSIPLTVSLGACIFPLVDRLPFAQDWQEHVHLADLALFQSKSAGRNRGHQIVGIADCSRAMLARITRDFAAAQAEGLIQLRTLQAHDTDADASHRGDAGVIGTEHG